MSFQDNASRKGQNVCSCYCSCVMDVQQRLLLSEQAYVVQVILVQGVVSLKLSLRTGWSDHPWNPNSLLTSILHVLPWYDHIRRTSILGSCCLSRRLPRATNASRSPHISATWSMDVAQWLISRSSSTNASMSLKFHCHHGLVVLSGFWALAGASRLVECISSTKWGPAGVFPHLTLLHQWCSLFGPWLDSWTSCIMVFCSALLLLKFCVQPVYLSDYIARTFRLPRLIRN